MVDIPVELFLSFIGFSIALAIFGFIRQPQVPAMLSFAGMFILTIVVITNNIIMDDRVDNIISTANTLNLTTSTISVPEYSYNVITGTTSLTMRAGGNIARGEFVDTNSILIGKQIECIAIPLSKTGNPTGTALIGVMDEDANMVKQFGSVNVTTLTTSPTWIERCLINTFHTIKQNDRIGVSYNGGDASNTVNTLSTSADAFDGTNTHRVFYSTSWSSATATDTNMQMYVYKKIPNNVQVSGIGGIYTYEDNLYEFTDITKVLFAMLACILILAGALMVVRT